MSGYSKEQQLARGERRYRRKVASPKQWQAIRAQKIGPCRVCEESRNVFLTLHHLIPRDQHGDDVPNNLIPLCSVCHARVEDRSREACLLMFARLTDTEYAYVTTTAGEDVWERVYGLGAAYTDPVASRRADA